MGVYLDRFSDVENPDREHWLQEHAITVELPVFPPPPGRVLLCVVTYGSHFPVGVIYNEQERDAAARVPFPKRWFLADELAVIIEAPRAAAVLGGSK